MVCNDEDAPLIQVAFRMEVEGLIDSSLLQLIPLDFAREITSFLLSGLNGQETTIFPIQPWAVEKMSLVNHLQQYLNRRMDFPRRRLKNCFFG